MNEIVKKENGKFSIKGCYEVLVCILTVVFFLIFSNAIVQTLFFNKTATVKFSLVQVLVYSAIYIGFLIGAVILLNKTMTDTGKKTNFNKKVLVWAAGIVVLFCLQIAFAKSYYRMNGWDVSAVLDGAYGLLNGEMTLPGYFAQNSNNIFLLLMFKWYLGIVIKFGIQDMLLATVVLNIVFIDIAIGLITLICKKIWGKVVAISSLLFSIPMLGFTLWMTVPYTDTLSMLFPVLIFYLFLKTEEKVKQPFVYVGLIGVAASVGWLFKPTNIIIVIAFIIIKIISGKVSKDSFVGCIKGIAVFVLAFILVQGGYLATRERVVGEFITAQDIKENENPFTHFLMMGMQKQETGNGTYSYGAYLWEDVQNTLNHVGQAEKRSYNMQIVKERLSQFGVGGYLKFLYDKTNWVCGDGTFHYGGEGEFYITEPPQTGAVGKFIQGFAYLETDGFQKYYANILQGLWVAVMCFLVVGAVLDLNEYKNTKLAVLRLTVIGILLFILMFEGRSRYLMNHLPIFILLAVYGLDRLFKYLPKRGNTK